MSTSRDDVCRRWPDKKPESKGKVSGTFEKRMTK